MPGGGETAVTNASDRRHRSPEENGLGSTVSIRNAVGLGGGARCAVDLIEQEAVLHDVVVSKSAGTAGSSSFYKLIDAMGG